MLCFDLASFSGKFPPISHFDMPNGSTFFQHVHADYEIWVPIRSSYESLQDIKCIHFFEEQTDWIKTMRKKLNCLTCVFIFW